MYDRAVEKRRELRLHVPEGPHRFVDRLVTSAPYRLVCLLTSTTADPILLPLTTFCETKEMDKDEHATETPSIRTQIGMQTEST